MGVLSTIWGKIREVLEVYRETIPSPTVKDEITTKIKTDTQDFLPHVFPALAEKIRVLLERAAEDGLEVAVFQSYRSFEEQRRLYNKGRKTPGKIVTKARPGHSWHNYGLAVDIVFKPKGRWSWAEKHDWNRLGELGKDVGLMWGGDWPRFKDRPHFQWPTGLGLLEAKKIFKAGGLNAVWREVSDENVG